MLTESLTDFICKLFIFASAYHLARPAFIAHSLLLVEVMGVSEKPQSSWCNFRHSAVLGVWTQRQ